MVLPRIEPIGPRRSGKYRQHFPCIGIDFRQQSAEVLANDAHLAGVRVEVLVRPFEMRAGDQIADIDDIRQGPYGCRCGARLVVVDGGVDDFLGHAQGIEQRDADAFVPLNDKVLDTVRADPKLGVLDRAVKHVKGPEVVYQAGQQRLVRIDPGIGARQDAGRCCGSDRMVPERARQVVEDRHVSGAQELIHGDGQGGSAYQVDTQAADRGAQILGWRAVWAV